MRTQGEWKAKRIANPAYKGKWVAPDIDNPDFVDDLSLYNVVNNNGFVGFELWQVRSLHVVVLSPVGFVCGKIGVCVYFDLCLCVRTSAIALHECWSCGLVA